MLFSLNPEGSAHDNNSKTSHSKEEKMKTQQKKHSSSSDQSSPSLAEPTGAPLTSICAPQGANALPAQPLFQGANTLPAQPLFQVSERPGGAHIPPYTHNLIQATERTSAHFPAPLPLAAPLFREGSSASSSTSSGSAAAETGPPLRNATGAKTTTVQSKRMSESAKSSWCPTIFTRDEVEVVTRLLDLDCTHKDLDEHGKDMTEESLLNEEYFSKKYAAWTPVLIKGCKFFVVVDTLCALLVPGAFFSAGMGAIAWGFMLCTYLYAQEFKDNKKARQWIGTTTPTLIIAVQALDMTNDSMHSSEQDAHLLKLLILTVACLYQRLTWTPVHLRTLSIASCGGCVLLKSQLPQLGQFEPLAFLLAAALGEFVGHLIDELQRTIFVLNRRQALSLQTALDQKEALLKYKDQVAAQQQQQQTAQKLADSMLNHTLKNILADAIASVDMFTLTSDSNHLVNAKLSMKRGMTWTRRRQSLILVAEGTYQLQVQTVSIRELLLECIDGRDIVADFSTCNEDVWVESDPMLLSIALENGISNALKHNPVGAPPPNIRVVTRGISKDPQVVALEITLQNTATPGAPFISADVEQQLFQTGTINTAGGVHSDGIGLAHAKQATKLLGGTVSLRQSGTLVSYSLKTTLKKATIKEPQQQQHHQEQQQTSSPIHQLGPSPSPSNLVVPDDFRPRPAARGMLLDDSLIARKYAAKVLLPRILGLKDWTILGENQQQLDLSLQMATAMQPDIIIIDENFDFDHSAQQPCRFRSGSDICAAMARETNLQNALLCIRSGNTSEDDLKRYTQQAGAHCVICKSFNNNAIAKPVLEGFQALQKERFLQQKGCFDPTQSIFPILLLD